MLSSVTCPCAELSLRIASMSGQKCGQELLKPISSQSFSHRWEVLKSDNTEPFQSADIFKHSSGYSLASPPLPHTHTRVQK